MAIKTLGLITRTADYKDNDRMLTLISPEYGKLSAKSSGCRKANGKLLACSQIFCYGEYMLYEKNGRYGVTSCEVRNSFFGVSRDINAFGAAASVAKICERASNENQPEPRLFALAVHALHYIESGAISPRDALLFTMIKVCDIIGFRPHLDSCAVCGETLRPPYALDGASGGLVCGACTDGARKRLLNEYDLRLMHDALSCPNRELARIQPDHRSSGGLSEAVNNYLAYYFEKSLMSDVLGINK